MQTAEQKWTEWLEERGFSVDAVENDYGTIFLNGSLMKDMTRAEQRRAWSQEAASVVIDSYTDDDGLGGPYWCMVLQVPNERPASPSIPEKVAQAVQKLAQASESVPFVPPCKPGDFLAYDNRVDLYLGPAEDESGLGVFLMRAHRPSDAAVTFRPLEAQTFQRADGSPTLAFGTLNAAKVYFTSLG